MMVEPYSKGERKEKKGRVNIIGTLLIGTTSENEADSSDIPHHY